MISTGKEDIGDNDKRRNNSINMEVLLSPSKEIKAGILNKPSDFIITELTVKHRTEPIKFLVQPQVYISLFLSLFTLCNSHLIS